MKASSNRFSAPNKRNSTPCTDHMGQHFPSQKAMCEAWGVFYSTYKKRIMRGWTQEQALTNTHPANSKDTPAKLA